MAWQGWTTLVIIGLVIALYASGRVGADLIMMGALTSLITLGVLRRDDALQSFANEGTVTIGVLFVVAAGLRETGAMTMIAQRVLGRPRSVISAQARLSCIVAPLSAFMYNTPLVAMMLPVVDD